MENQHSHPVVNLIISAVGALFAWVTLKEVQLVMTLIATGVSVVSGCLGGYQFYLNIKQKHKELNKDK